jgi:phosphonoacetaldehyde hydrolase
MADVHAAPLASVGFRAYRGPLRGVIFDRAGTMVDFGSRAPVAAITALFAERGVPVSEEQARGPMGLHKRDHIRTMLQNSSLAAAFAARHGRPFSEDDVEAMYRELLPLTLTAVRDHATLIEGAAALCEALHKQGLRIGSTTGYSREMMAELLPLAAAQGYRPDAVVTVSEVPAGRPAPWMCFRNAEQLDVYPMAALVKIGDTAADIAEGLSAGMWTVGFSRCGNEVGLSESALAALSAAQISQRIEQAAARLLAAGAHYVVEGPAEVPAVLAQIEERLSHGEAP